MKYKAGDHVRIKSLDWYDKNKDMYGLISHEVSGFAFTTQMSKFCGEVVTIEAIDWISIKIKEDLGCWCWHENMIEGLAWSETEK